MKNSIEDEDDFLARWVTWALWALAAIVVMATITGQVESFNGLYIWFSTHGVTGFWADWAPLMIDGFTVIGELAIFAGISRHWDWKSRILPWISAMIGICSSVAANVGDKVGHPISWELTAAVPPLAGAFGIIIGLGVLKRVAKDVRAKNTAKNGVTITPDLVHEQLMKDNQELAKLLEEAQSASVLNISPEGLEELLNEPYVVRVQPSEAPSRDQGLRGMDVLIPPKEEELVEVPEISQPETQPTPVLASFAEQQPVSREEARARRLLRPDRGVIYQTGSFPVVT